MYAILSEKADRKYLSGFSKAKPDPILGTIYQNDQLNCGCSIKSDTGLDDVPGKYLYLETAVNQGWYNPDQN